ncbi:MAG: hypothetical protein KA974_09725 [Saprospiraceae bacterium]|nr:hypothetical protein [Saprospiraceae bacterium]MBP7699634.1 hypothetical protein [Saprospiraceae bacterium]
MSQRNITLISNVFQLFIYLGVLTFIVVKSATLQVTCDESYTLQILAKERVWDIVMYTSSYTNNHILNTLAVKGLYELFGLNFLLGRLPNILSFLLYGYIVFRFAEKFIDNTVECIALMAIMVGSPYLLDFFACARGYGMTVSLIMVSMYYGALYITNNRYKNLVLCLFAAILCVYAQFGSLHYFLAICTLLGGFSLADLYQSKNLKAFAKQIATLITAAVVLFGLIYFPIKSILKDNQIAYYGKAGFWQDTIRSLIQKSIYGQGYFSSNTLAVFEILTALLLVASAILVIQQKAKNRLSLYICLIFWITTFSIVAQFKLLGNQYPIDRTALFLYPIIMLNFVNLFACFKRINKYIYGVMIAVAIIFPINHLIRSCNLKSYAEWWYDVNTFEVLSFLKKKCKDDAITFYAGGWFRPSFSYHIEEQGLKSIQLEPYSPTLDTTGKFDYYYIFGSEKEPLTKYTTIEKSFFGGNILLLKNNSKK